MSSVLPIFGEAPDFVGRAPELERLDPSAADTPTRAFVTGPAGVGKSALLAEIRRRAAARGIAVVALDARELPRSPADLAEAVTAALPASPCLVTLDAFDADAGIPLPWLRSFVATIPDATHLIVAGRARVDGARSLGLVSIELANLEHDDALDFVTRRGVPAPMRRAVLEATHGHPLALVLASDEVLRRPGEAFSLDAQPDLVRTLLQRLVWDIDDDARRDALSLSAVAYRTTEDLLAELVDKGGAAGLFRWLATRPFMGADRHGLWPHDLVRELLDADLKWRRPPWRRELLARIARYHLDLLKRDPSLHHATIRAVWFAWREELRYYQADMLHASVSVLRARDIPALDAIVSRHLGPESQRALHHWLERGADVLVARDQSGEPCGFALFLWPGDIAPEDAQADPGVAAMLRALSDAGELVGTRYMRFFLDRERGQLASPTAAAISAHAMERAISWPSLRNVYSAWSPPELGLRAMSSGATERFAAGDFTIDGHAHGIVRQRVQGRAMVDWFIEHYVVPLAHRDAQGPPVVAATEHPRLSRRQRETLAHLLEGRTIKEVAVSLNLSPHTVGQYVKALYKAFGVTTRGALVARALKDPQS